MPKWKGKNEDSLEKFTKIRRKSSKSSRRVILASEFECPESKWSFDEFPDGFAARVVEVHKRYAFVSTERKPYKVNTRDVWLAEVARKYLQAERQERNFVAVGDRVFCVPAVGKGAADDPDLPRCVIQNLAPRTSRIARLDPHNADLTHVLAANMDQVVIVASYLSPTVKWGLIDRYLVLAESEGISAVIVLNKADLLDEKGDPEFVRQCRTMEQLYRKLGYKVLSVQADRPDAADQPEFQALKEALTGRISLVSGHSGVGKSTIVNLYDPEIVQAVEENDDIFYKGRHTTSFASFIKLRTGGYIIDTPGIRSFTFEDLDAIHLSHCFVDLRPYLGQCRYRECRHLEEPECAVKAAVEAGEVDPWRYKSYLAILLGASGREGRIRDMALDDQA